MCERVNEQLWLHRRQLVLLAAPRQRWCLGCARLGADSESPAAAPPLYVTDTPPMRSRLMLGVLEAGAGARGGESEEVERGALALTLGAAGVSDPELDPLGCWHWLINCINWRAKLCNSPFTSSMISCFKPFRPSLVAVVACKPLRSGGVFGPGEMRRISSLRACICAPRALIPGMEAVSLDPTECDGGCGGREAALEEELDPFVEQFSCPCW